MRPDPSHDEFMQHWTTLYEKNNYGEGAAGYFLTKSHEWSEREFGPEVRFPRVLEVGAGTGVHIRSVRHQFDEYVVTDLNPPMLDELTKSLDTARHGDVLVKVEDATRLTFPDHSFDRLIAAHVLEHLYKPHEVLREWARVLKPGGVLTLVLPCDPGVAWRLGRQLSARKKFTNAGVAYDYWMAREHVNPLNCLVAFIEYYFPERTEGWYPFRVPSMDINLFYIAHIRV